MSQPLLVQQHTWQCRCTHAPAASMSLGTLPPRTFCIVKIHHSVLVLNCSAGHRYRHRSDNAVRTVQAEQLKAVALRVRDKFHVQPTRRLQGSSEMQGLSQTTGSFRQLLSCLARCPAWTSDWSGGRLQMRQTRRCCLTCWVVREQCCLPISTQRWPAELCVWRKLSGSFEQGLRKWILCTCSCKSAEPAVQLRRGLNMCRCPSGGLWRLQDLRLWAMSAVWVGKSPTSLPWCAALWDTTTACFTSAESCMQTLR